MMRKLTDNDLTNITKTTVQGYQVENVRIKRGDCADSDHYGIILGVNRLGNYVTWQFHLDNDEKVNPYWGHYFMQDHDSATHDYDIRDMDVELSKFKVTITEKLKLTVKVEAKDQQDAEQIASDYWHNGEYILDADNFVGVEFEAASEN